MQLSNASFGFLLSILTAFCWGALPFALQEVLKNMDTVTIVWYRFLIAAIGMFIILKSKKKLPKISLVQGRFRWLIIFGAAGLCLNFVLFNLSLEYLNPSVTQVIGQISPFVMMIASIVFLKEKIGVAQKIGSFILIAGLILFFNDKIGVIFTSMGDYTKGVIICVIASVVWVFYGLAQKLMLIRFTSQQILCFFYFCCAIIFTPFASYSKIFDLTFVQFLCLLFCCLNTVIAYGAYGEALNKWDTSKVSAIITLTPLFTIVFAEILTLIAPHYFHGSELNLISYGGAFIVVFGALFSVLGQSLFKTKAVAQ